MSNDNQNQAPKIEQADPKLIEIVRERVRAHNEAQDALQKRSTAIRR